MVCNEAMENPYVREKLIQWMQDPATHSATWSSNKEGLLMDQGSSSCPHPCN